MTIVLITFIRINKTLILISMVLLLINNPQSKIIYQLILKKGQFIFNNFAKKSNIHLKDTSLSFLKTWFMEDLTMKMT